MAVWRKVIESKEYQSLPVFERLKTKDEFFRNTISVSDKFTSKTKSEKEKLRLDFFTSRPEERLDPFLPEKPTLGQIATTAIEEFQTKSPFKVLDQPFEQVAQFVEPKVPAGRTTFGVITKDLPRQLIAETIRAYKPSAAGAFFLASKLLKPAIKLAKPVARAVGRKIPSVIKKPFLRQFTVGK